MIVVVQGKQALCSSRHCATWQASHEHLYKLQRQTSPPGPKLAEVRKPNPNQVFFFCVCVCVFSCVCFGHCFAVVLVVAKIRPPSSLCSPAFFASSALWGFIFFPRGGLWLQEPFVLNLFFKWQFAPTKYTQSLAGQVVTVVMAAQAKQQQQPHHMAAARRGQGGEQQ